jgi:hypothetical protein
MQKVVMRSRLWSKGIAGSEEASLCSDVGSDDDDD